MILYLKKISNKNINVISFISIYMSEIIWNFSFLNKIILSYLQKSIFMKKTYIKYVDLTKNSFML